MLTFINISIFFCICLLTAFALRRFKLAEYDLGWYIFYLIYFPLLFFYLFLPLPERINAYTFADILNSVMWNPFLALGTEWDKVLFAVQLGKELALVDFFLHHISQFLLLMPLADFVYSAFNVLRRECLAIIWLAAAGFELLQFVEMAVSGNMAIYCGTVDIVTSGMGAGLFLLIGYILDDEPRESLLFTNDFVFKDSEVLPDGVKPKEGTVAEQPEAESTYEMAIASEHRFENKTETVPENKIENHTAKELENESENESDM